MYLLGLSDQCSKEKCGSLAPIFPSNCEGHVDPQLKSSGNTLYDFRIHLSHQQSDIEGESLQLRAMLEWILFYKMYDAQVERMVHIPQSV